jgi:hypothetical protein
MRTSKTVKPLLVALSLSFAAPVLALAEPAAGVKEDVGYLLGFIAKSGCSFYRNGSWSDSKAAEAHVRMKYDYLSDRNEINTARDFIEKAASASSLSGSPYQVKCPGGSPVLSRAWLGEELARYTARANKVTSR